MAILVTTGCSSSDGSEDASTTTDTANASASQPEPTATARTLTPAPTRGPAPTAAPTPTSAPARDLEAELLAAVEEWQGQNGAPAVSLSVRLADNTEISVARGVTDLNTGEAVSTDDYFRIASISKTMTAAVMMQLVEDGLVELDVPVTTYLGDDWLGEHPSAPDITVRQLMDHTNGLIEYAFDLGFYVEASARQDVPYEPEEILEFLGRQEPLFEPGTAYQYETGGFVASGLIIEAVTGNSAAAEIRARLFEPSGADNIYLTPEEFPPQPVVNAYARGELYTALRLLPGVEDPGQTLEDGDPILDVLAGEQAVLQSAGWTGGGNEAQMESVSAIWRAMFDGTILKPDSVAAMTTPTLDQDVGYGLGVDVDSREIDGVGDVRVWSHGGGVPGFRSQAGWLPDHNISYAFSASLIPLPEGLGVGELQKAIMEILLVEPAG